MATDTNIQSVLNKQRNDKFRMILTLPKILLDEKSSDWSTISEELVNNDSLQYSIISTNIPEISIPAQSLPTQGQTVKVTSQIREAFQPITSKFTVDNRFRNYWVLWKWMEKINDPTSSWMVDDLAMINDMHTTGIIRRVDSLWDYQTRITIQPLDEYNNPMCEFLFYNAFITKLGGINFNYQDSSQVDCDFTFEFSQMDLLLKD